MARSSERGNGAQCTAASTFTFTPATRASVARKAFALAATATLIVSPGRAVAQSAKTADPMGPQRAAWREAARAGASGVGEAASRGRGGQSGADAGTPSVSPFRTYDGTGNNPAHPRWGSAGSRYLRERSGAHYADGIGAPTGGARANPRVISNTVVAQADATEDDRGLSTCVYEFGQFLDHDIGLAQGGSTEDFDIAVPSGDPYFDPNGTGLVRIFFDRSAFDAGTGVTTPRQQVNLVTSFIDASMIYGSDSARAAWLREGVGGRMKVRETDQGVMLPLNDGTLANDNPLGLPATSLVAAGDVRANEQPGLTTLHTAFLREHNLHAARLALAHPGWDDERLYQEARRIVGAEMQVITYREFLPAILGRPLPPYRGYDPRVNPGLSNAFATAAYRIGHSMVGDDIDLLDAQFNAFGIVELADAFFNPTVIPDAGGISPIVRYFATNIQQATDTKIVDPLRNFLFGPPGAGGFDLGALNIQRGRDHGLADYNTLRADFGLPRVTSFAQITSNADLASALASLYTSVDEIDPWVGMLAEDHLPGSSIGRTHAAVITDQFLRLRDGDRFWYQNNQFPPDVVAALESTTLSGILRRTTDIAYLQRNVFFAEDLTSPPACAADFNNDGAVNTADLVRLIARFGDGAGPGQPEDLDGNGTINTADLTRFLSAFGTGCP
jgi:hypothetical protein